MRASPVAGEQLDRLVGEKRGGVVGVVGVDGRAELDLAHRLVHRLAHLAVDDLGQLVGALPVELTHAAHEVGALGQGGPPRPRPVRVVRSGQGGVDVGVGRCGELALDRTGAGVADCVLDHRDFLLGSRFICWGSTWTLARSASP